jgi:hypothetical protein
MRERVEPNTRKPQLLPKLRLSFFSMVREANVRAEARAVLLVLRLMSGMNP